MSGLGIFDPFSAVAMAASNLVMTALGARERKRAAGAAADVMGEAARLAAQHELARAAAWRQLALKASPLAAGAVAVLALGWTLSGGRR